MEPWAGTKIALCKCGGAISSCPWSHRLGPKKLYASVTVPPAPAMEPSAGAKKASCKCGGATSSCPWSHGLGPKKLYASVVVPPAPVHGAMGWGQKSFMQVWWYHQLLSMEPWAAAKKTLCKCGGATSSCPCSHGLGPKKLYASVVVPLAPVHVAMGWGQKNFMQVWWCH